MTFCLLTLAAGMLLAACVPVMQFAIGLLLVTSSGFVEALWFGSRLLPTLGWAVAFFALAQVGYALGLAVSAALRWRRLAKQATRDPASGTMPASPSHAPLAHRDQR